MNKLCHRRLFIESEPGLESPNIITVKPLPTASENNIKKCKCFFFNELYNFTVLFCTFIIYCMCVLFFVFITYLNWDTQWVMDYVEYCKQGWAS